MKTTTASNKSVRRIIAFVAAASVALGVSALGVGSLAVASPDADDTVSVSLGRKAGEGQKDF